MCLGNCHIYSVINFARQSQRNLKATIYFYFSTNMEGKQNQPCLRLQSYKYTLTWRKSHLTQSGLLPSRLTQGMKLFLLIDRIAFYLILIADRLILQKMPGCKIFSNGKVADSHFEIRKTTTHLPIV